MPVKTCHFMQKICSCQKRHFRIENQSVIGINPHMNMQGPHGPHKILRAAQTIRPFQLIYLFRITGEWQNLSVSQEKKEIREKKNTFKCK